MPAGTLIGSAYVRVDADTSPLRGALRHTARDAESDLSSLGRTAQSASGLIGSGGASGGGLTGALGGFAAVLAASALPALGAFVPLAAGAGLAAATLKLGFAGVSDAVALAGEDQEKYNEALKKMSPASRAFTKELVSLKKEFAGVGKQVQGALLPGFTYALQQARPVVKSVKTGLVDMADALGDTARQFGRLFKDSGFQKDFSRVLKLGTDSIREITGALAPFTQSLIHFGAVSKPTLDALSRGISGLLSKGLPGFFSGLERGIEGSAALFRGLFDAINRLLPALGRFAGQLADDVGPVFEQVFGLIADQGVRILGLLTGALRLLKPVFRDVASGVAVLRIALGSIFDIAQSVGTVLVQSLWPSFGQADKAVGPLTRLKNWLDQNKRAVMEFNRIAADAIINFVTAAINAAPTVIGAFRLISKGVLTALDAIVSGAAKAFGWLPGIGPKLKAANAEFDKWKGRYLEVLDGAEKGARDFANRVGPSLTRNRLLMNIRNWTDQLAQAKRELKTVPPEKRSALLARIDQLQRQIRQAKREIASIPPSKTTTITVNRINRIKTYSEAIYLSNQERKGGATGGLWTGSGFRYGLAGGGLVRGPGTPTSDSIWGGPFVSRDEYVTRAAAVRYYGVPFMDAVNSLKVPKSLAGFAGGGLVGSARHRPSAGGGGPTVVIERLVLENHGVIGSQRETDTWLATSLERLRRTNRLTLILQMALKSGGIGK